MKEPLNTVSSRLTWVIKDLTRKRGVRVSQAEFGKPLGVSGSAVGQWLAGTTASPTPERLFAIEDAYGYTARWISTGKGPRTVEASQELLSLAARIAALPPAKRAAIEALMAPDDPEAHYQDAVPVIDKSGRK